MISPTEPHTTVKAETIRRTPDNFYWAMWDKLDIDPIELDEFLRHWHLSRGDFLDATGNHPDFIKWVNPFDEAVTAVKGYA